MTNWADESSYLQNNPYAPYQSGSLASVIRFAPFVVHVNILLSIIGDRFTDDDIKALLHLDNLQQLKFSQQPKDEPDIVENVPISFHGGIVPLLEKFGPKSLEMLTLKWFTKIDADAIVQHCSQLRSLNLSYVNLLYGSKSELTYTFCHPLLPNLEVLVLCYVCLDHDPALPIDISALLLSSPALVQLNLCGLMNGSIDRVLEKAALHHGFPHLESFIIQVFEDVNPKTIDLMLTLASPLKQMQFFSCPSLKIAHFAAWQKKVRDNKWDLSIKWFE